LAATGMLSEARLRASLDAWRNSRAYQTTIAANGVRVDLDGEPTGGVADVARQCA
jgi:sRNA-binding protein